MYHRSDTPFGGKGVNLQDADIRADRVTIRPSLVLRMLSLILFLGFEVFPAANWVNSREQPPQPWEIILAFGYMALNAFLFWYAQSRTLTVDETGVEWRGLFRMRRLTWRDIHDYGFSYAYLGRVRLYFSKERQDTDGRGRKHLSRTDASVLLHIQNRDKTGQILKVCRRYTRIRPFLCSEEGRLEGVLRDR